MAFYKNKSDQKVAIFETVTSTGAPKTGDAANITAQISLDSQACAATTDVNPDELDAVDAPGIYIFSLTTGETDANLIILSPATTTAGMTLRPVIIYTEPSTRDANVVTIANNAITAAAIADAAIDNATFAADVGTTAYATNNIALAADKALVQQNLDHLMKAPCASGAMAAEIIDATVLSWILGAGTTANYEASTQSLGQIAVGVINLVDYSYDEGSTGFPAIQTVIDSITARIPAALTVSGNIKASIEEKNAAIGLSAQDKLDVNTEVDNALNTAIPGSPTADSVNERVKALDVLTEASGAGDLANIKTLATTNLDATVSSRLATAGYTAPDNTTITAINDVVKAGGTGDCAAILLDTGTTLDGKLDTIDTNVDAVLVDTGTTLNDKIDIIDSNVDSILTDTGTTLNDKIDVIDGIVDSILVDTGTTLNDKIDIIDSNVDLILTDTGTTLQGTIDKLENMIEADGADWHYTVNALEHAPTGTGSGLTAQETRNAMQLAPTDTTIDGSVDGLLDDLKRRSGSGGV